MYASYMYIREVKKAIWCGRQRGRGRRRAKSARAAHPSSTPSPPVRPRAGGACNFARRGTSPIGKRRPPYDAPTTLGEGLR